VGTPMRTALLLLVLSGAARAAEPYTQSIPGTNVKFEMVPVPGGVFTMGSPPAEKGRKPDEGPQFEVEVEPFHMGRLEVTWGEYEAFSHNYHRVAGLPHDQRPPIPTDRLADAVTYPTPIYSLEVEPLLDRLGGRGPHMPAVSMSNFSARQYTKWLSRKTGRFYRLPTEAEWEYACRAGTKNAYSFGDDPAQLADYAWDFDGVGDEWQFHPGGRKKPNAWGLHDMHGNVAEWCLDAYDPKWYARFAGRRVRAADAVNWPTKRYPRVLRGGSYQSEPQDCRSAARLGPGKELNIKDADYPKSPHWETDGFWVGFRVMCPAREPPEAQKNRYGNADDPATVETLKRDRELIELVEPPPRATPPD
jgi:formylglycine-generating enzyme